LKRSQSRTSRSWLFVPGDRQGMLEKADLLPADALMLDLEDGVAPEAKPSARLNISAVLDRIASADAASKSTPARYVRINAIGSEAMHQDLALVIRPGLHGLVLPKVETVEQVSIVERVLDRGEPAVGIAPGSVLLLVSIESPRGLLAASRLADCSPRICGLIFGGEDFSREMNLPLRREGEARGLIYARSAIAVAAAAVGVQAVDAVWTDLRDSAGLIQFATQSRRLGFSGMSAIHPSQLEQINAAFSPTEEEIAHCKRVVEAYEEARGRGQGVISLDGEMLDPPVVERARRTLEWSREMRKKSG
jgi:citrate lyase subunit beta / citryl-CoA lyase